MEPHKIVTPAASRSEGQSSLPRPPKQKRRFQIVKLEERIAPSHGKGSFERCNTVYGCVTKHC